MVQVSYPGVYIQEVPSGINTITGVSTSIAAFFGRTARGPINKAVRCLSLSDFTRAFGGPHPASDLAQSVRQFFDNGGMDCYVVRLAHNAEKASVTLQNFGHTNVLTATAKHAGAWGNALRLEIDFNTPSPEETFNLRVVQVDGEQEVASESFSNLTMNRDAPRYAPDFVSQSSGLIDLALASGFDIDAAVAAASNGYSESRRPLSNTLPDFRDILNNLIHPAAFEDRRSRLEISVNDGPYIAIDLRADPAWPALGGDRAAIAQELTNRINVQLGAVVPGLGVTCTFETVHGSIANPVTVLRITSVVTAPRSSVRIRRAPANDLTAPLMLGLDQGGVEFVRYAALRPAPTATLYTDDINALARLEQQAFNHITLSGVTVNLLDGGSNLLETTGATDRWYGDALASDVNDHNDGVREKLNILAKAINGAPAVPCRAEVWGYRLALIPTGGTINSTIIVQTGDGGGGGTNIGGNFTDNVRMYALGNAGTSNFQAVVGTVGTDDDGNPPNLADYLGSEADQTGFHALDAVDLFNLMVLPADRDTLEADHMNLWGPASIYCQQHRAFLLIDAPTSWTQNGRPVATQTEVNSLRSLVDKRYSAVFYPRLQYSDRGVNKYLGSSGAIAGLMARIDATRGVWKAPAGTEADILGINGLEVKLTDRENGVLNKLGANCLRVFPSGFVNWGARTMDGSDDIGSEWKYVPIRRLALFLEESLYRGTKWIVFEPNDEPLWAKIRLNLNAFMMGLFRQGAFQGSTPDQAFYVKCDAETTTQADRNLGIVNIEVGFAPLKPAEFVVIKIQQIAGNL